MLGARPLEQSEVKEMLLLVIRWSLLEHWQGTGAVWSGTEGPLTVTLLF